MICTLPKHSSSFSMAQQPKRGQGRLIAEVYRSHIKTNHSRQDTSGRVIRTSSLYQSLALDFFPISLTVKSSYLPKHHLPTGPYNKECLCLLWGRKRTVIYYLKNFSQRQKKHITLEIFYPRGNLDYTLC